MSVRFVIFSTIFGVCLAYPPFRIVNGTDAKPGEIPYIVSVRFQLSHICGGSILGNRHILTAAHCIYGFTPEHFSIQYGKLRITEDETNSIRVESFISHENFTPGHGWINDVAILTSPIPFDRNVQPVALPSADAVTPSWSKAVLAGWGYPYSNGDVMKDLQRVDISIYSDDACEVAHDYETSREYHLCAGVFQGGKGQCSGDSGGPLVLNGVQYGIVSWSVKPCALIGYPGVFVRVSAYISWIQGHELDFIPAAGK